MSLIKKWNLLLFLSLVLNSNISWADTPYNEDIDQSERQDSPVDSCISALVFAGIIYSLKKGWTAQDGK